MDTKQLIKLFEPGKIGKLELRNRIIMPPMATELAHEGGYVTDALVNYYRERAKGGVGLVIIEATCIDSPVGKGFLRQLLIDDDRFLPGLTTLAQAIKGEGAKAAIQLHHAGNAAHSSITKVQPVAPSSVIRRTFETAKELTTDEIKNIVRQFIKGALRARGAGFDAVEIHGAHQYLLAQFLSPAWNERKDEYGGEIRNRARIIVEIIRGIKEEMPHFPVIYRFNAQEYGIEDFFGLRGLSLGEAKEVAKMAEEAGADAIHVSCIGYSGYAIVNMPQSVGAMLPLAQAIKEAVSIPVIAVGRITPQLGEAVLKEGKADFIAIGRGLIADPHLPRKAKGGNWEEITPCIACLNCLQLSGFGFESKGLRCTVNPVAGREGEYKIAPAAQSKKVLIIGGGPAGMEAAIIAASRGHRVSLYEAEPQLGGQLLFADKAPLKDNITPLTRYLVSQVKKRGIDLHVNTKVTPELVERVNPDVVILATGVIPLVATITGIENPKVVLALEVLSGEAQVGDRVEIIGGEMVGCETAEFLTERGKKVTIVRRGKRLATKMAPLFRRPLVDRLQEKGVNTVTGVSYKEITDAGLVIINSEGKEQVIEADNIVLAAGASPNTQLLPALKDKFPVHQIGDCVEPRNIMEAIHEGFSIGYAI